MEPTGKLKFAYETIASQEIKITELERRNAEFECALESILHAGNQGALGIHLAGMAYDALGNRKVQS